MILLAFAAQGDAQTPLQAHLEPEHSDWVLGVPVEFYASVANVSTKPVRMWRFYLDPQVGDLTFLISPDGSNFREYFGPHFETQEMSANMFTLQPGQRVLGRPSEVLFNFGHPNLPPELARDLAFPAPGTYFVKARAVTALGVLMSNQVRLVVKPPRGDDSAVWETLEHDIKLVKFIQAPEWDSANDEPPEAAKLRVLLERYPKSSHAPYIKKALDDSDKQKTTIKELKKARSH
jgi:hypothetical protein